MPPPCSIIKRPDVQRQSALQSHPLFRPSSHSRTPQPSLPVSSNSSASHTVSAPQKPVLHPHHRERSSRQALAVPGTFKYPQVKRRPGAGGGIWGSAAVLPQDPRRRAIPVSRWKLIQEAPFEHKCNRQIGQTTSNRRNFFRRLWMTGFSAGEIQKVTPDNLLHLAFNGQPGMKVSTVEPGEGAKRRAFEAQRPMSSHERVFTNKPSSIGRQRN